MARYQIWLLIACALVLTIIVIPRGRSEHPQVQLAQPAASKLEECPGPPSNAEHGSTCTIYPLSNLGEDPGLGAWIAETIPATIRPGTWASSPVGPPRLRYYAPAKVLVVYHSPVVHAEISAFLKDLKTAIVAEQRRTGIAAATTVAPGQFLMPVQYVPPPAVQVQQPEKATPSAYPVPAQERQPKHLFHFIIRYEGEGVIDNNVAKMMEGFNSGKGPNGCDPLTTPPSLPPCLPGPGGPASAPDSARPPAQAATLAAPPPPPPPAFMPRVPAAAPGNQAPKPAQPKPRKHDKTPKESLDPDQRSF